MKKILLSLFAVCILTTASFAQNSFSKGSSVVSVGAGIGSNYYGSGYSMTIPPVFASYEYGIVDNLFNDGKGVLGIGALLGYTGASSKVADVTYKANYMTFAALGNLHYQFVDKLDTYAGLSLGYYKTNQSISGKEVPGSSISLPSGNFAWGLQVGGRYYFTPGVGVMAEVGYGISVLKVGVSFRF